MTEPHASIVQCARPGCLAAGGALYYAALRPSEAVMLRENDLLLPGKGWGRIDLVASASRAGTAWTDHGTARQERGLKHRADHETRAIPVPPDLVKLLRAHIRKYGTTPDGRIFQTARGGILQDSAYAAVWAAARAAALTPATRATEPGISCR
jgi:integrase